MRLAFLILLLAACGRAAAAQAPAEPFELADGDRVVFLGSGLVEREQLHGYVELALATRWPERDLLFRNLGWSGDTVHGEARGYFTRPPSPFERLVRQLRDAQPTVVFVGYGANEAGDGPEELERFTGGLERLLDSLAVTGARVVLLSPAPHEAERSPAPDVAARNEALRRVGDRIAEVARRRGHRYVDLFTPLVELKRRTGALLTSDGLHLNETGYYALASVIESGLGLPPRAWRVVVDARRGRVEAEGTRLAGRVETGGEVGFTLLDAGLPLPAPAGTPEPPAETRTLAVRGLAPGRYTLTVDRRAVATASAEEWARGVRLERGPAHEQAEALRRLIAEKNRLFFQQYRPPNDEYILGFRKYEQGRHAEEIDEIGPLIDARENEIGRARVPVPHVYRLALAPDTTTGPAR